MHIMHAPSRSVGMTIAREATSETKVRAEMSAGMTRSEAEMSAVVRAVMEWAAMVKVVIAKVKHKVKRVKMEMAAGELTTVVMTATVEMGMAMAEVKMEAVARAAVGLAATVSTAMTKEQQEVKRVELELAARALLTMVEAAMVMVGMARAMEMVTVSRTAMK